MLFYTRFERFWHWIQAVLIILLLFTGFAIHEDWALMEFSAAVNLHDQAAWGLIALTAFAIFWHFTTDAWKQYTPTLEKAAQVIIYYTRDIFTGGAHPIQKTTDRKLNPLQRISYFSLKIFLFPFQLITGILYMYYNPFSLYMKSIGQQFPSVETLALLHTAGAFAFLAFLIIHVYLATTGETVTAHFKAMITGWEEVETDKHRTSGKG